MNDSQHLHPAQRLILLRQNLGMSQRELAKEFQVSSGTVALWEMGTHKIPGPVIKLIDLYEQSLNSKKQALPKSQNVSGLKTYFKTAKNDEHERALRILEKGFSEYLDEQSSLDFLGTKIKSLLIERLMKSLIKTHGVSAKVAQLASFLEVGLPYEVRNALGTLQYRAKPMPSATVRKFLGEEYGSNWKKTFTHFRDEPVAVTSLGQVHYARLANGQEVAVKIQHPEIKEILNSQMNKIDFLQSITFLLGKPKESILTDIRSGLMQECNYRLEAENQEKFRQALLHDERIIVPKIHHDLLRDRVLVSDYIKGKSFQTFTATALPQERAVATEAIIEGLFTMAMTHCLSHTDLHPGNFLFTVEGKVVLLDFGRVIQANNPQNIKAQCLFYLACYEDEDFEKARNLSQQAFSTDKDPHFDFSKFWALMHDAHPHLLTNDRFHFTRTFAKKLGRQWRDYSKDHKSTVDAEAFWGSVFSISTWGLFADLDAKVNYRKICLNALKLATKTM